MIRREMELSSGFTLVLMRDDDGEFVLRLLRRGKPSVFLTPKCRINFDDLERLTLAHNQRVVVGRITLVLEEKTAMILADGELAGWGPRPALSEVVTELIRATSPKSNRSRPFQAGG